MTLADYIADEIYGVKSLILIETFLSLSMMHDGNQQGGHHKGGGAAP